MTYGEAVPSPVALRFHGGELVSLGRELAAKYANAFPYPHVVIDGLFPDDVLDAVVAEFPPPGEMEHQFDSAYELKSASSAWSGMGPTTRSVLSELNFGPYVEFLEELTGINGLVPDPFLVGGGQHQISRGGKLGVHADFNVHKDLNLDRRLNVLVYLNREWRPEWGGELELWDAKTQTCSERILPTFNRCVVFSVTDVALHGHPEPLQCPAGLTRKSLALYYYTNGRPDAERSADHTTLFHSRPRSSDPTRVRRLVSDLTPPLIARSLKNARERARSRRAANRAPHGD